MYFVIEKFYKEFIHMLQSKIFYVKINNITLLIKHIHKAILQ